MQMQVVIYNGIKYQATETQKQRDIMEKEEHKQKKKLEKTLRLEEIRTKERYWSFEGLFMWMREMKSPVEDEESCMCGVWKSIRSEGLFLLPFTHTHTHTQDAPRAAAATTAAGEISAFTPLFDPPPFDPPHPPPFDAPRKSIA